MADGDTASVDVYLLLSSPRSLETAKAWLAKASLISNISISFKSRPSFAASFRWKTWGISHQFRVKSGHSISFHLQLWDNTQFSGFIGGHHHHCSSSVIQAGGVARCYGAALHKTGAQLCQFIHGKSLAGPLVGIKDGNISLPVFLAQQAESLL